MMEKKNKGPFTFVVVLAVTIGAFAAQIGWSLATVKEGQAPFMLTIAAVVSAYWGLMLIPALRRLVNSDT